MNHLHSSQQDRGQLARDIQFFKEQSYRLKQMFKETVTVLSDLQSFKESLSLDVILDVNAQRFISNVVSGKLALVVMGEISMRAPIINEILGEAILPSVKSPKECWREINFKFHKSRHYTHQLDGFEVTPKDLKQVAGPGFVQIRRQDILIDTSAKKNKMDTASLEVCIDNILLKAGVEVVSAAGGELESFLGTLKRLKNEYHPFFVFALDSKPPFSPDVKEKLRLLRLRMPFNPVMFVTADLGPDDERAMEVEQYLFQELLSLGFLSEDASVYPAEALLPAQSPETIPKPVDVDADGVATNATVYGNFFPLDKLHTTWSHFTGTVSDFFHSNTLMQITNAASSVHDAHARSLQNLIYMAHDMARDHQITPQRIQYARDKETVLYQQLVDLSSRQASEIKELVMQTVREKEDEIVTAVVNMQFEDVTIPEDGVLTDSKTIRKIMTQIQDMVYRQLSKFVADRIVDSISFLRESAVGTLKRCLENLEESAQVDTSAAYTTEAFKQIIDAAYQLEFSERNSFSAVRLFFDRLRQNFRGAPWKQFKVDATWREKYARQLVDGLSASRLAKSVCQQFRLKVMSSHDTFDSALRKLESHHSGRLRQTAEQREKIKKILTPKMARLSLSSIALRDGVIHGLPNISTSKELGRGQYGVVYACQEWAGQGPCAVKSLKPPDEKHWNDLAMEFHYTWCLPKNNYIVSLLGAVIYDDEDTSTSTVFLIMPRYPRDLHAALKVGLDKISRMQIAKDVVEGIRFLHSQGLLHRDIKLKNVMLDNLNRAKLADLGFCKPEAMMTHTVVGTPIHMAPEMFAGAYDPSVDIYAFGILFWYICSNQKDLPQNYSQCGNKEQLWGGVKRGLRPERLQRFDERSWSLMQECWTGNPKDRPLIGLVAEKLEDILFKAKSGHAH